MEGQFLAKVSFVNKISILMKATSDDDKPISGYLYEEISKISKDSDENCETLVDFLNDRLRKDSSHVKLKALKVMKYVLENGHPNFRLGLLKKSTDIRESTKHSGPPDPLHGSVPYHMVRKAAQNLSEMLFNLDTASVEKERNLNLLGIGPSMTIGGSKQSKMEGFGSTSSLPSKSFGENVRESLLGFVEHLGETTADQQRGLLSTIEGSTDYTPPQDTNQYHVVGISPASATPLLAKSQEAPVKHVAGRAGGGWDDSDEESYDDASSKKQRTKSASSGTVGNSERLTASLLTDYIAEENLVSSYLNTADSTPSLLLKRQQVKAFIKECSGLNCDQIIEFLNVKLSSTSEKDVMRALMLIEAIVNSDLVSVERLTTVCRDSLVFVLREQTGQLQTKARKLIRILEKLTMQHGVLSEGVITMES